MSFTSKTIAFLTTTVAICATAAPPASAARLPSHCAQEQFRLQAYAYYSSAGLHWKVHRYEYRITGGVVRRRNNVNIELVSNGRVVYSFASPDALVNDGRWYTHEQTTYVPKLALTHTRFQGIFDIPGFVYWASGDPYCRSRTLPQLGLPAEIGPLELSLPGSTGPILGITAIPLALP